MTYDRKAIEYDNYIRYNIDIQHIRDNKHNNKILRILTLNAFFF